MELFNTIDINTTTLLKIKTMYSLDEIYNIEKKILDYELPEFTTVLIERINNQINKPTYIKTPIFKKKQYNNKNFNKNFNNNHNKINKPKKNNKVKEITDDEWQNIRNFESTKINKKTEGIEKHLNVIRNLLNKLSDENYNDILFEIKYKMNEIVPDATEEELIKVGKFIFETSSYNKFFSKLYAKIYGELIQNYDIMKSVFDKNYKDFNDNLNDFETADPDTDYDLFCIINKKNEIRRGVCAFVSNLVNEKIITIEQIFNNIKHFIQLFNENISKQNSIMITEEISELLFTIIKECINTIYSEDEHIFEEIKDCIEEISEYNVKKYPSLNNKIIFKFMDIMDIFESIEE
jgi:hypothetical protein